MKRQVKVCYGISSKVYGIWGVFMADFDGVSLAEVKTYLKDVQYNYDISDIYVIRSTNGYNAIALDIMPVSLVYQIGMNIESPADRNFYKAGMTRDYFTLRFDSSKKLLGILKNKSVKYEKSLAHKLFLEWFFGIKIPDSNFNDTKTLDIIQYPSSKDGYHLVDKELPDYFRVKI